MVGMSGMRKGMGRAWLLVTLATCAWAGGAAAPAAPAGSLAPSAVRGEIVYRKACAACHGDRGDGKGPAAQYLDPRPRDFTSGTFKFRSTPNGELPTDADLVRIVADGVPGTQMPAWKGVLTDRELVDVVAYVKGFSEDFTAGAPEAMPTPEPPPESPAAVSEGRMVYMLMECWACHGGRGRGDGKSGKTLEDDWGRKIRPWNLTRHRYKAGNDPKSLYRTFSTGLNGTPMPAYALDGFLVPGDAAVDPAKYSEGYSAADIEQLKEWLAGQPGEAALRQMPEEERLALGEKRKWALVFYIRSLIRKPGLFARLFVLDMEVTP
jgi:mono/diheme cytochrome c family protein